MREGLHLLGQTVGMQEPDRLHERGMQGTPALLEDAPVGDLVGQRVLERVLEIREEVGLVQELRGLSGCPARTADTSWWGLRRAGRGRIVGEPEPSAGLVAPSTRVSLPGQRRRLVFSNPSMGVRASQDRALPWEQAITAVFAETKEEGTKLSSR
jgi:hypothetical protein